MRNVIDFRQVKREASFADVLERYGINLRGSGPWRMVLCPFHPDRKPSCSVNMDLRIFRCFGCDARGSILDFVARLDGISIRQAANAVADICGLANSAPVDRRQPRPTAPVTNAAAAPTGGGAGRSVPKLSLDPAHPYLILRGVTPELAEAFGIGWCGHGSLRGRIGIPIHDERGSLVAYAGRWASDDIPDDIPKYLLPKGFAKQRVLFNLHRIARTEHIAIVEGYWSVFRLHALGIRSIALMGRSLSAEQELLLLRSGVPMLTLLLDGDPPGREATGQLLPRLAERFFVHVVDLPDGTQPDTVPEPFLIDAFCTGR